jgi:hypothetical protein
MSGLADNDMMVDRQTKVLKLSLSKFGVDLGRTVPQGGNQDGVISEWSFQSRKAAQGGQDLLIKGK